MRQVEEIINRQINRWNHMAQLLHQSPHAAHRAAADPYELGRRHPVICISRDLGSGARLVAKRLSAMLGYEMFGSAMIDAIARDLNVQRQLVDGLDESGRGGLQMMFESYLRGREIDADEYLAALIRVVQTIAMRGGVILLGRGAGYILHEHSALNVWITAPLEKRIERLMTYESLTRDQALHQIQESDRAREKFIRTHFKKDFHDMANYDLTVNLDRIQPQDAAELVLAALEARGFEIDAIALPLHTA